jgi:hypothetical protein
MNEARPYIMTLAGSVVSLNVVDRVCAEGDRTGRDSAVLVAGVALCAGASMLNLVLVPGLMAYAALKCSKGEKGGLVTMIREHRHTLLCLGLILGLLGAYYLETVIRGHGGQREPFTWMNAGYALYEMLGFGGLGAPRILIRELSPARILAGYSIPLGVGLGVWGAVLGMVWVWRREVLRDDVLRSSLGGLVVGTVTLAGIAVCFQVSLWGRHFMAMVPFLLLALASLFGTIRKSAPRVADLILIAVVCLFALSSFRQRVFDEYRKDPIREAMAELDLVTRHCPDLPAILITTPLVKGCYGGEAGSTGIPVVGWTEQQAKHWQEIHPVYAILVHRADKFDPNGYWPHFQKHGNIKTLWRDGNIRIFRVDAGKGNQ